jgi:hypothetical protein
MAKVITTLAKEIPISDDPEIKKPRLIKLIICC